MFWSVKKKEPSSFCEPEDSFAFTAAILVNRQKKSRVLVKNYLTFFDFFLSYNILSYNMRNIFIYSWLISAAATAILQNKKGPSSNDPLITTVLLQKRLPPEAAIGALLRPAFKVRCGRLSETVGANFDERVSCGRLRIDDRRDSAHGIGLGKVQRREKLSALER